MSKFDFSGWATKANLKCSDGRTILKDAFKHNDGQTVPLVWNHQHNNPDEVLGHALLENRDEGVYAYCKFNDTESGQTAKLLVEHGDVNQLSIYANQLQQKGNMVLHGAIKEVSLVLAGANPGAFIDSVIKHSKESDEKTNIYTDEDISLYHADEGGENSDDSKKSDDKNKSDKKSIKEILNTLNEEQKDAVAAVVGMAIEDTKKENESNKKNDESKGGDESMKHNVFDNDDTKQGNVLSHADQEQIINMAKSSQIGTFQNAFQIYA